MEENQPRVIEPQPGPQTHFLECSADIAIFGGSAGGSKSYSVILDILRGSELPKYRALVLRRQFKDLTDEGAIIDDMRDVFGATGAKENGTTHSFKWQSGASVSLGHMDNAEKDHLRYKSKSYAAIYFEELTEFLPHQFWYMPSRNRSVCGMRPYIRATTNPQPGWVADLLISGGYVDDETGLAVEEMSGVIAYLIRDKNDAIYWFKSVEEAKKAFPDDDPISFTFIRSKLEDNKKLLESDPDYVKKLNSLPYVERQRLLYANWKTKPAAGLYFKREYFHIVHRLPRNGFKKIVRAWDLAGSRKKNQKTKSQLSKLDFVGGPLIGITEEKNIYFIDVKHFKGTPAEVRKLVESTANADKQTYGNIVTQLMPEDPAQAGQDQADQYSRLLLGKSVKFHRPTGSKITRAEGYSSAAENGLIYLLYGPWNEAFLLEHEAFPDGDHDDLVDPAADGFNFLIKFKDNFSGWV